jgi:hypothetical protein
MTRRTGADHEASYARLEHRAAAPPRPDSPSAQRRGWISWGLGLGHVSLNNNNNNTNVNNNLEQTTTHHPPPTTGERCYRAVEGLSRLSYGRADRREIAELGIADAVHVTRRGCGKPCVDGRGGQESDRLWLLGRGRLDHGGHRDPRACRRISRRPAPDENHRQPGSAPRPCPPRRIGRLMFPLIG